MELYLRPTDVSVSLSLRFVIILTPQHLQLEHVREIQEDPDRLPAFAIMEVALGITLVSPDTSVSHLAGQVLRAIVHTERKISLGETQLVNDLWPKRHALYENLGDPNIVIVGGYVST